MTMWWGELFGPPLLSSSTIAAAGAAAEAGMAAHRAQTDVEFLTKDLERLSMVTQALWQILKEEHGYDDDMLRKRVMDIDLGHGHDGEGSKAPPLPCPGCGRPVSRRHSRCIYCGAEGARDPFAR